MSNHKYTPTTEQVRDGFRCDELAEWYDPVTPHHVINGRAFDRWLATVEAAAEQRGAEQELRQAALEWSRAGNDANVYAWLHYRADRLTDQEDN